MPTRGRTPSGRKTAAALYDNDSPDGNALPRHTAPVASSHAAAAARDSGASSYYPPSSSRPSDNNIDNYSSSHHYYINRTLPSEDSAMGQRYLALYQQSHEAFERARILRDQEEEERRAEAERRLVAEAIASGNEANIINNNNNNNNNRKSRPSSRRPSGSKKPKKANVSKSSHHEIPLYVQFLTYLGFALLTGLGYIREAFRHFFPLSRAESGYAPMVRDFDDFYQRRFFSRIRDLWNRPINSRPGRIIGVMERVSKDHNKTMEFTGKIIPAVNLGSYNYLGFADDFPYITNRVMKSIDEFGIGGCASAEDCGLSEPLYHLERTVAAFLGKQDAVVCGMGFATNFGGLPALLDKGTLVLSDQLNHASLIAGVRASAGKVSVFPHNRLEVLEDMIEEAIVNGQERTHLPWRRIVIMVEGIYSMEGEIIDLRRIVEIKKRYNCLLYVDEAHSIGALGDTGRGICEHTGVSPTDVDILMGTFTKSFGSIGGYLAGDADVINYIRHTSSMSTFSDVLSPGCAQQALGVFEMLMGRDGTTIGADRIRQLAENARFFRKALTDMGLTVYGEDCSPVIPVMIYMLGKMPAFSRSLLKRNIAVVVVGYPATPLLEARARFCVSAAHTREDLERALEAIEEVAVAYRMIYQPRNRIPKEKRIAAV